MTFSIRSHNMPRKKQVIATVLVALLVVWLFPATTCLGAGTRIKIATIAPETSTWVQVFNAVNQEVKQKTADGVRFRIYSGGVMGDEKDMLRKMMIGQIHGAVLSSSGLSALFKEIDVFQIPFLFNDYAEVDYVVEKLDDFFHQGFERSGYVLIGWSEGGFVHLMSTTPVTTLTQLQKAKVWTWEDAPMAEAIFNAAGVAAIPLSVPDVMVGLQTGLVEVVYAPPAGAVSLQWFTKVKYLNDVPLNYLAGGLVIQKKLFERIPADHREILLESFANHMMNLKRTIRTENRDAMQVMAKHGVQILTSPAEEIAKFKELSDRAVYSLGQTSFSDETLKMVNTHLETYRRSVKP